MVIWLRRDAALGIGSDVIRAEDYQHVVDLDAAWQSVQAARDAALADAQARPTPSSPRPRPPQTRCCDKPINVPNAAPSWAMRRANVAHWKTFTPRWPHGPLRMRRPHAAKKIALSPP